MKLPPAIGNMHESRVSFSQESKFMLSAYSLTVTMHTTSPKYWGTVCSGKKSAQRSEVIYNSPDFASNELRKVENYNKNPKSFPRKHAIPQLPQRTYRINSVPISSVT